MGDSDDGNADIYKDLPHFKYDETLDRLNATISKLEAENNELHSKLIEMKKEKEVLETNCSVLSTNITSLLKTAKLEVQRKERTINDLRKQLNEQAQRSKRLGLKRQFENTDHKHRYTGVVNASKRDSKICEPARKKTRFGESDKVTNNPVPRNDESTNGNLSSLKPLPKPTHASQKENVPLTPSQRVATPDEPVTIPRIAAPSLPKIDCPTLFSTRMYQRIYNKNVPQTVTLPSVPFTPTNGEEPLNRISEEKTNEQQNCSIESEKTVLKSPEKAEKLLSSPSSSQKSLAPSVIGAPATGNRNSAKVHNYSCTEKLESSPRAVSGPKKVAYKSVPSKDHPLPLEIKSEIGKIDVDSDRSVIHPPKVAVLQSVHSRESQESTPESRKRTPLSEESSKLANTNGSLLKLPLNLKGKSGTRKMFVPISNSWNCLQSSSSVPGEERSTNKCQQIKNMANNELCSEVTSELTVKIDDEKFDEKRKLALDVFGSPVKWADDCSSDSAKVEGTAVVNRKKAFYSIFGSPYKNGDSCSSEPSNFFLPPGAYEDSCWTNHPSDKASPRPIKPPTPLHDSSNNLVNREKSSQSTAGSHERDYGKKEVPLPPPAHPIGKKVQSVFSPLKDSKTATSLPSMSLDDRSATGICFPFKSTTGYEDSVLGQFDDTAQFVSALAKVDTKISPLKNSDHIDESKTSDSTPMVNLTSFKEVFQNKILHDVPAVSSTETLAVAENSSPKPSGENVTNIGPLPSDSVGMESPQAPEKCHHERNVCNTDEKFGKSTANKEVVDSSSRLSSKFIHRSNFSSSSVFSMSSDSQSFLDKPVNVLQPRKTPRTIANKRSSVAPDGSFNDVKLNPRIAIPDAFITEQEERVRQWEKNHLYEETFKNGFTPKMPSPTKNQVKIHNSNNGVIKTLSPTKSQSKMSSPGKNRTKPTTPSKDLGTSTSFSKAQVKTDVVNRLQPKRVPRHVMIPKKNCGGLLKTVATVVNPEEVNTNVPSPIVDEPPPPVGDPPCAIDTTIKALDMIRSVIAKTVPISTTCKGKNDTIDVTSVDGVHEKTEPVENEKPTENLNPPKTNRLVAVKCKQRSSKFVEVVSQIKANNSGTSDSKPIVSKISVSSTSLSSAVVIKKPIVRKVGDFKRSSALKNTVDKARDNAVKSYNNSFSNIERLRDNLYTDRDNSPSSRKVIRRKSAPNLCISSQSNVSRITSKTPIRSSFSACPVEKKKDGAQVSSIPTADAVVPNKWIIHPIELDDFKNRYEFITSSFSSNDPRAQPRSFETRALPISEDRKDPTEGNLNETTVVGNLGRSNVFSPNVSAVSRDGVRGIAEREANLTRSIVTSTPFPMNASRRPLSKKQLIGNESPHVSEGGAGSRPRSSSTMNETISLGTRRKAGRPAGRKPMQAASDVRVTRRSKRQAETQLVLTPPKETCTESTVTPRHTKSPISLESSTVGKPAEAPLVVGKVSVTSTLPDPKPVILNQSNDACSMTPLSQSANATVQPKLISRKRRNPNFSSVTVVHSTKSVIIPRKKQATFTVSNSST